MIIIGEALVEDDILTSHFSCDLHRCKGACCTLEGGRGAPLTDDEVDSIQRAYPFAAPYLSSGSLNAIRNNGLVEGTSGNFATSCVDGKECAFAFFEDGTARCSFERAYLEGKTAFRKPVSCHLFPIRVSQRGKENVRYEKIDECAGGRAKGSTEGMPLHQFMQEPLKRRFGASWYDRLAKYSARTRESEA